MAYRRDKSAGVIVFHRTGRRCRFLLILSKLTKRPLWEFPKGGIDEGETALDAALRELEEETGLTPGDVTLVPGFEHTERYRFTLGQGDERTIVQKQVTYFLAETKRRRVRLSPKEAHKHAWLEFEDAMRRLRYPARRRILQAAVEAAGCMTGEEAGGEAGRAGGRAE